jgi:hypothetical protein
VSIASPVAHGGARETRLPDRGRLAGTAVSAAQESSPTNQSPSQAVQYSRKRADLSMP